MTSKLPPGAHSAAIPGSRANERLKGAVRPKPVVIGKEFLSDPRGGPELVAGPRHVETRDNRSKISR